MRDGEISDIPSDDTRSGLCLGWLLYDVSVCVSMSRLAPAETLQDPVKTPPATPRDLSLPAAPRDRQTED